MADSRSNKPEVAVVTGGNRGLGLATCRGLAKRGVHVVMTCRDPDQGLAAIAGWSEKVDVRPLDVTEPASVIAFTAWASRELPRLDVLVNNAAVALDGFNAEVATRTINANFGGPLRVTDALLPLMQGQGRIVMVSSGLGALSGVSAELRKRFSDPRLSREELIELADSFVADVAAGKHRAKGWPSSAYNVSKIALNALTRLFARDLSATAIRVNAVCPGWVRTDMGGRGAPRSVAEGAASILWAATLRAGGPTGGFFRDGEAIEW